MSAFFHSIRWRVQIWHGLILLVVIVAFCLTAYQLAWNNQLRRIDRNLVQTERTLIHAVMESGRSDAANVSGEKLPPFSPVRIVEHLRSGRASLPAATAAVFSGNQSGYAYFSLRDADGRVLLESPNAPGDLEFLPVPAKDFSEEMRVHHGRREMLRSAPGGLRTVVGLDLGPDREEMRRFAWSLAGVGGGVWLLGLLGGWWLSGRAIQPIAAISRTATRIAEGNLAERIGTAGTDSELDQLSRVLNRTFDRLHRTLERQKQFTADASHELRTPVTILLAETQRALKRDRTPEEYHSALEACRDVAGRMRRLTESLLLLARQEEGFTAPPTETCDLAELLRESAAQLQPLAAERGITLHCDLQPAVCFGDHAALSIVAANLVGNAIQHHPGPAGQVFLASAVRDGRALFTVRDDGRGIPAADLPHIFERFYRADKARTGSSGHAGLGLAIARTIVENHGGRLEVESPPGRGACFTVTLPARIAV
jgi:heavy metal sensor kinase